MLPVLACLFVCYASICLCFFLMQERLIYFPSRQVRLTPGDFHLPFEEVRFQAADGVKLHGWLLPPLARTDGPIETGQAPWVLFCHGNGGNMVDRIDIARALLHCGAGIFLFDYRGYGCSEGHPSEQGLYLDAGAAWDVLARQRGVPAERIVVMGESLGGGVASAQAERQRPGGLILQSTFTSLPDVGATLYPWLPVRLLARQRFPTVSRVGHLDCPKLIMHSPQDELIPFPLGKALFEAAREPKTWLELKGGHNAPVAEQGDAWTRAVRAFLEDVTARTLKTAPAH